jgi:hypothetical protein
MMARMNFEVGQFLCSVSHGFFTVSRRRTSLCRSGQSANQARI